ncbi:unnamed protein product [Staurois parvus]|uniref:Uncharacterized protein n=1 Tax=Staurois parvus TaxID=386267 RepID=A0ABN9C7R2_9NEOB|nr:unnamed protein product [Staurois parvus]
MYINGWMGTVQERVSIYAAIYACPLGTAEHRSLYGTSVHSGTPITVRDLCVRSRSCDH